MVKTLLTYNLFKLWRSKSYFGQSVYILKASLSATTGTEHPPGSVIPSNGQGFGFLWQKTAKSRAYSFGSITRLACKRLKIDNKKCIHIHTKKFLNGWVCQTIYLLYLCKTRGFSCCGTLIWSITTSSPKSNSFVWVF